MTTDRALIALIAGTALAALATLAPVSAALGIAGAAICFVALGPLAKASDAFGPARFGAILSLVGSVLLVIDVQAGIAGWLVLLGLLLLLTGSCAGLRDVLPDGFRRAATGRISSSVLLIMLTLALLLALDQAKVGPTWVSDVITAARVVTAVLVVWFVAFVTRARTDVPARVS
jgi:hypothetical protein